MSIQLKQTLVKASVAAVNLNIENGASSKQQEVTTNAREVNANARFDSYISGGAYGFLAMKL